MLEVTANGFVKSQDSKVAEAELPCSIQGVKAAAVEEVERILNNNQQAKEELIKVLSAMGFSAESAARLLRLDSIRNQDGER